MRKCWTCKLRGRYKVKCHGVVGHEWACGQHLALLLSIYKRSGAWAVTVAL